jgi:hypothetical protein
VCTTAAEPGNRCAYVSGRSASAWHQFTFVRARQSSVIIVRLFGAARRGPEGEGT